uniref:transposase n=1 Tax=Hungatella hathewayi TaxID=154046 RepID=UPI00356325BD
MHCIISGGGLTADHRISTARSNFFIPVHVLRNKFRGKNMALLVSLYQSGTLVSPLPAKNSGILTNGGEFRNKLYLLDWCHTSKRLSMDLQCNRISGQVYP